MRGAVALAALSLVAAACGDDEDTSPAASSEPAAADTSAAPATTEAMTTEAPSSSAPMMDSTEACDADAIVAAVQGGQEEGTLEGMTDDPVATAASNNPVLTTLVAAVSEAGLVDTLNGAEALTVFAPTDCAFAALDPATMDAAMADPTGLLATVLGFHVIPERLEAADLAGMTELETFTGEILPIEVDGDTVTLNGGQATVVVPDIQTANATVHLIDAVMLPPSVSGEGMDEGASGAGAGGTSEMVDSSEICDADEIVAAVEGGDEEGTLEGMTDDPVATAASNNPVLTTLVTAVGAAGLGDTLNGAEALTVFAPTDCAFAALDPATLEAALADPSGLLTTVLGFHVIPERLEAADLAGMTDLITFTGESLPIVVEGDTVTLNGGQATVVVADIQTANATVHLIDNVMLPPSAG